jgi:hypothetical protein
MYIHLRVSPFKASYNKWLEIIYCIEDIRQLMSPKYVPLKYVFKILHVSSNGAWELPE